MALSVTGVSPAIVKADGGYPLYISGTFVLGHRHQFYIYPGTWSTSVPKGYSGVPGQGYVVYPLTATLAKVYTPVFTVFPSAFYDIRAEDMDTLSAAAKSNCLTVEPSDYGSAVFTLRRHFPPMYRVGPRDFENMGRVT